MLPWPNRSSFISGFKSTVLIAIITNFYLFNREKNPNPQDNQEYEFPILGTGSATQGIRKASRICLYFWQIAIPCSLYKPLKAFGSP